MTKEKARRKIDRIERKTGIKQARQINMTRKIVGDHRAVDGLTKEQAGKGGRDVRTADRKGRRDVSLLYVSTLRVRTKYFTPIGIQTVRRP